MLQRKISQRIGIGTVLGEWEETILNRVTREGLPEKVTLGLKQNKTKTLTEGGREGSMENYVGEEHSRQQVQRPRSRCQIVPETERGPVWLEQHEGGNHGRS